MAVRWLKEFLPPQQYLDKETASVLIKSSATHDIDFFISAPQQEIGGYSLELK